VCGHHQLGAERTHGRYPGEPVDVVRLDDVEPLAVDEAKQVRQTAEMSGSVGRKVCAHRPVLEEEQTARVIALAQGCLQREHEGRDAAELAVGVRDQYSHGRRGRHVLRPQPCKPHAC
jgi:hypothetical protein